MTNIMTNSAALYFDPAERESIPVQWLDRVIELFTEHSLSPILFTASGADFSPDDCHVFGNDGDDIALWNEVLSPRKYDLIDAMRKGEIESLVLDTPQPSASSRRQWRASVRVSLTSGVFRIGVVEGLVSNTSSLIVLAHNYARQLFNVRYGIAYKMGLAQHPDSYATGGSVSTFADAAYWIRHRDEWEHREKSTNELWSEELRGARRYLMGLFRGAYPASLLSTEHVRSAALLSRGIGKLTELDSSLWLWELSDAELPEAQKILESRTVLVSQAAQA
jgi:hypothetical protein